MYWRTDDRKQIEQRRVLTNLERMAVRLVLQFENVEMPIVDFL